MTETNQSEIPLILIEQISKHFGGFAALDKVSLKINKGSITGLIGPNGAGKTTLFDVIAGALQPSSGKIYLNGRDITGLPPHELFAQGILRTFQIPHEFSSMSVKENLMVIPAGQIGENLWNCWFKRSLIAKQEIDLAERAKDVMEFLTLSHLSEEPAGNLSGGQKKLLELGRTMMTDASLVFVDEVGAGVNRTLLRSIEEAIIRLNRERGYTICIIEHDFSFVSRLCDPIIVLAEGRVLAEGKVDDIRQDRLVIEAYLGRSATNSKE